MTHRFFTALFLIGILLSACTATNTPPVTHASIQTPTPTGQTVTVFAAASLTEAFNEIAKAFEAQNPGTNLSFQFAGSQQLTQQLAQGAPADVFASANQTQMDAAIEAGRITSDQFQPFAGNKLVMVYTRQNPGLITQIKDLAKPGIKLVLADKAVPVGKYSLDFLDKAAQLPDYGPTFKDGVLKNVVSYEQDVRSVLTKVVLGEADAGIVYLSDLKAASVSQINVLEIPPDLNVDALYYIAPVQDSKQA
ncbi:MAG: molybdenum transporter, periplasmic molybdate-binding protein, partial [Chloroflexi bacterium]|nr:molybdenum transporter, periplasmic molybdate-binding protein [Chloroflexota bacterium]